MANRVQQITLTSISALILLGTHTAKAECKSAIVVQAASDCFPASGPADDCFRHTPLPHDPDAGQQACVEYGNNVHFENGVPAGFWSAGCLRICPEMSEECIFPGTADCRGHIHCDEYCDCTCSVPIGRNCVTSNTICSSDTGTVSSQQIWNPSCTELGPPIPDAPKSTQEYCDDCDNDEDGLADNVAGQSIPIVESCNGANQCSINGTRICQGGTWSACDGCGGRSESTTFTARDGCSVGVECLQDCSIAGIPPAYSAPDPILERTWCGDFHDGDLWQWNEVECGGPDGSCPQSGGLHGIWNTITDTPRPLGSCVGPDSVGCRFEIESTTDTIAQKALLVRVANGDISNSGARNEMVQSKEQGSSGSDPVLYYTEGDNRFYRWKSKFVDDESGSFPDAPPYDGTQQTIGWHVIFQFHHLGVAASPPVEIDLNRYTLTPGTTSPYELHLYSREQYSPASTSTSLWQEGSPIIKNAWYEFILHVNWSVSACSQARCVKGVNPAGYDPDNPDGGFVELWVKSPATGRWELAISEPKITLFKWIGETPGFNVGDHTAMVAAGKSIGDPMDVYLKAGLYRDHSFLNGPDTAMLADVRAGTSCMAVIDDFDCTRK